MANCASGDTHYSRSVCLWAGFGGIITVQDLLTKHSTCVVKIKIKAEFEDGCDDVVMTTLLHDY